VAWSSGKAYEAYVGRWSRRVAAEFVAWLDVPPGRAWADVGCGTGALTATVLARAEPARVVGVDTSEAFLADARAQIIDPRAEFHVGDARSLPLADGSVDAAISGLAVNFVPEPSEAVAELVRITAPGGLVAAYVWDYAEGMEMMRHFWNAAMSTDPDVSGVDEALRFPLCRPGPLRDEWAGAGLTDVTVRAIEVPTVFAGFDDYWQPFLGGQGPAPSYVAGLSDERRADLREALRERLPADSGGAIGLTARAWAVRGRRETAAPGQDGP
jgi:SAM-dependent methyltransferase